MEAVCFAGQVAGSGAVRPASWPAMRIASLSVGHQTWARPIPPSVLTSLLAQQPDSLVLVEYVEGQGRPELRAALANAGLAHIAASDSLLRRGKDAWWNQVFIASRWPIEVTSDRSGMHPCNGCGFLSVKTGDLAMTGARVPMWPRAADWYGASDEMLPRFEGDLLIGDLNIDPSRGRRRDQEPLRQLREAGWRHAPAGGGWSFQGRNGTGSAVDHVFVRDGVEVVLARYVAEGIIGVGPVDHAALVVDLALRA